VLGSCVVKALNTTRTIRFGAQSMLVSGATALVVTSNYVPVYIHFRVLSLMQATELY